MNSNRNRRLKEFWRNEVQLIFFSILVGVLVGAVVGLYNIAANFLEHFSVTWYESVLENLWALPLLFVALFAGAFCIGVALKLVPMARGSGIPQIEGAARGLFKLKWFRMMVTCCAASLGAIFFGLNAGAEGPSMFIGGTIGDGVADLTKRNPNIRRHILTGGASAGLAVAFNAPLTGFVFAFEEAHKKFTPEVFICAFFSVISGILTRNGMRMAFGLDVAQTFTTYDLTYHSSFTDVFMTLGFVLIAAVAAGLLGVAFFYCVKYAKRLFSKITFLKGLGKFFIPFGLAGAFGLISFYAMGGGHSLIEALGSNAAETVTTLFTSGDPSNLVVLSCALILLFKFIATVVNLGCGMPCGAFIPMLATGALLGGILSPLFQLMGMDAAMSDIMIMICMATFFATVVRAPLTSMIMVFELTGSFGIHLILPVMLAVSLGYMIGKLFGTDGIYDFLLTDFVDESRKGKTFTVERLTLPVAGGLAAGRAIRDIIWPNGVIVESVARAGETIIPDGQTVLSNDDLLSIAIKTDDREKSLDELLGITGKPDG